MTTADTYNPFITRPGIAPIKSKKQPAIDRRIDKIVELAKRYEAATAARNYWDLVELSYEYSQLRHMQATAARVMAEAAEMEKP